MRTPLALGPLAAEGFGVRRSGIRWLRQDGDICRPGALIAQVEIRIVHRGASAPLPFAGEQVLQVGLASPLGGRLGVEDRSSGGGWLDQLAVHDWDAGEVVASIKTDHAPGRAETPMPLRRLMLAGRRMVWMTDTHSSLLPGWNLEARGWWDHGEAPAATLLCLGICDVTGWLRGAQGCFAELCETAGFPGHIVHVTERPIAPCAPILLEQLLRTPGELKAINQDLRRTLWKGGVAPTPEDYLFAGALMTQMSGSPLKEPYDILGAHGLKRLGPADVVLLSAAAEPGLMLRHRELGYAIQVYNFDRNAGGPAIRAWLDRAFEPVTRSVDDVRRDLERLIDEVQARTGARFIIANRMSSSGRELIDSYAAFPAPLDEQLDTVRAKAVNLMLHDLARSRPVSILDVDALAAAIGGRRNLPDGVHSSGPLQDALRRELLRLMRSAGQSTRNSIRMSAAPAA